MPWHLTLAFTGVSDTVKYLFLCSWAISVLKSFAHFLLDYLSSNWVVEALKCILDTSLLPDMTFANIFSRSVACLVIFLMVSWEKKKFYISIKSHVSFVFFFRGPAFMCLSPFRLFVSCLKYLCLISGFCLDVMDFGLTFSCAVHFELRLMYGVR